MRKEMQLITAYQWQEVEYQDRDIRLTNRNKYFRVCSENRGLFLLRRTRCWHIHKNQFIK